MRDIFSLLKSLADETRLELLKLLLTRDLCVGALAYQLQISEAAVSQHLQQLRKAGLVRGEKRGYWTHYFVEKDKLLELARALEEMTALRPLPELGCIRLAGGKIKRPKEELKMCASKCQYPEKLKGKPEECSPEQIKKCHGSTKKHPCTGKKGKK
ncbi:MAG: ArsR/SmtB family transcription factor [Thermodesulfobacteriota bacterium]